MSTQNRVTVLRAEAYVRMPWKNGGGETCEIAVFPPAATLDSMQWRISMATVAQDGPFSLFPGIDRTLCVLDGVGMELDFGADAGVRHLTPVSAPLHFSADVPVQARLLAGTITDLNVMTRRGRYRHVLRRLAPNRQPMQLHVSKLAQQSLLFCERGALTVSVAEAAALQLGSRDALLMQQASGPLELTALDDGAVVCLVELYSEMA